MINTKEYIDFLLSTGLSQRDFLLLFLIYKNELKLIEKFKAKFPSNTSSMLNTERLLELIDEDWLEVDANRELKVTNKFTKYFIMSNDEALVEELLEIYPPFYDKGGINIPLVTVDIYPYSLKYNRKINNSINEHKEIIKDLQYGINVGLIRFGIAKFIDSKMWVHLRKLRLKQVNVSDESFDFDQFDEDF